MIYSKKNFFYYSTILKDKTFQKNIIQVIDQSNDVQQYKTDVKAKMTDWHLEKQQGFNILAKYILSYVENLSYNLYGLRFNFFITQMWGLCYKKNDFALDHDHWPSVWSAVYYIDPPKDGPELIFPEMDKKIFPLDGMLVVFPGWVVHEVPKKQFDGSRYVVSTNLSPIFSKS